MKYLVLIALLACNAWAAPITPRIVTKVGRRPFHVFRTPGNVLIRSACTQTEFDALFTKGAKQPTLANHTYVRSILVADYGTTEVSFAQGDATVVPGGVVVGMDTGKYFLSGATVNAGRISAGTYGPVVVDAQGRVEVTASTGTVGAGALGRGR